MTFQTPEVLLWRGQTMALYSAPLEALLALPGRNIPFVGFNSAARRRYIAEWEIDDDGRLLLRRFDPRRSHVCSLEPLDVRVDGWMAVTSPVDGAAHPLRFGVARLPLPDEITAKSDVATTWVEDSHAGMVLAMPTAFWESWNVAGGAVALETTTSYFALAGHRPPTDPPQAWDLDGAFALTPEAFHPINDTNEVPLGRLGDFWAAHDPIDSSGSGWDRFPLSSINVDGTRELVRGALGYLRTRAEPARLDLAGFRWFRANGSHAATLADVEPDLGGPVGAVHATWFDGELRVVANDALHDEQVSKQFRIYRWDGLVFDHEIRLEVRRGMVVGEPYSPETTAVITQ